MRTWQIWHRSAPDSRSWEAKSSTPLGRSRGSTRRKVAEATSGLDDVASHQSGSEACCWPYQSPAELLIGPSSSPRSRFESTNLLWPTARFGDLAGPHPGGIVVGDIHHG